MSTANSTEALNIAINGMINPGDHVISTDLEHNSVLRPLYRLESEKRILKLRAGGLKGKVDYRDFERLIRKINACDRMYTRIESDGKHDRSYACR